MSDTTARDVRETLANLCHEQWSGWMQYLFGKCYAEDWDGKPHPMTYIPTHMVERWIHQMNTPYAKLSESEQNSDRNEADKFIAVFAAALSERERETTERCAVIAENMADGWFTELAREIAQAIRADAARRETP